MGMTAALKARQVVDHVRHVLAIELLVASQALDFRAPAKAGRGAYAAHQLIRQHVPHLEVDRELHRDVTTVVSLIESGALLEAVRHARSEHRI
jgi:histidine ammonia-lyase